MSVQGFTADLLSERYQLLEELGSGGQATVYRARDLVSGEDCAVKIFKTRRQSWDEQQLAKDLERLEDLNDPRLCPILKTGRAGNSVYVVMPVIKGKTLARELAELRARGPEPRDVENLMPERLRFVEELARGVHELHESGLIHRDIKPSNVMILPEGSPVLLDLGLAVPRDEDSEELTLHQAMAGSAAYMAPERTTKGVTSDRRIDVFALGALLYEALTSERVFGAATTAQVFESMQRERIPRLRARLPKCSISLESLIFRSLASSPERRPATAIEFAEDLALIAKGVRRRPGAAQVHGRFFRWARNQRGTFALAAIATLMALLSAGLLGLFMGRRELAEEGERILRTEERERTLSSLFLNLSEGSIERAGSELRSAMGTTDTLDAELVTAATFFELVSERPLSARQVLEENATLVSRHPELRILEANSLRLEGRYEEARAIASAIPPSTTATGHFIRGLNDSLLSHDGNRSAAERAVLHLREALALESPARAIHLAELVHAARHAEQFEIGMRASDALIQRWPDRFASWFWRGFILFERSPALAIEAHERALSIDPTAQMCQLLIAVCHHRLGRSSEAITAIRDMVEVDPKFAEGHRVLASLYFRRGEFDEAHRAVDAHLSLRSRSLSGLTLLTQMLHRQGRIAEAAEVLRRLLELGAQSAGNLRQLSRFGLQTGFFEEARAAAAHVRRSGQHPVEDAIAEAWALSGLGRTQSTIELIESALDQGFDRPSQQRLDETLDAIESEESRIADLLELSIEELPLSEQLRLITYLIDDDELAQADELLDSASGKARESDDSLSCARLVTLLALRSTADAAKRRKQVTELVLQLLDDWSRGSKAGSLDDTGAKIWLLRFWKQNPVYAFLFPTRESESDEDRALREQLAKVESQLLSRWLKSPPPSPLR